MTRNLQQDLQRDAVYRNKMYMLHRICGTCYSPESVTRLENPGKP